MNKRLILLSVLGTFAEWGPGCLLNIVTLAEETVNQFAVGVRTGGEWLVLSRHADQETASGKTVVWLQAILAAVDGGLLHWDDEKQQVVDELEEDEEAFAEPVSEETLDDIEQKFLKLLAQQEPDHPWVCKLRTPREGNHPRSKEFVRR